MCPERVYTAADLVDLMAPSLGREKATAIVSARLVAHRVFSDPFDGVTARSVLGDIAKEEGIVGVTARVAVSRIASGSSIGGTRAPNQKTRRPLSLLVALLAPTIGKEHAQRVIDDTARMLGHADDIDLDQALALLERIASSPGVVGIAARFAKTRVHLSW